jgi:hypothetical protein
MALVLCLNQCNHKNQSVNHKSKNPNLLLNEWKSMRDSVNMSWEKMMASDDNKISDIKRLLDEISYIPKHDLFLLDSLRIMQAKLKGKRYNQQTMQESNRIDLYDMATDSLIKKSYLLAQKTPEIQKYANVMQLIQDINAADNEVVIYRVKYDKFASRYNAFMIKNKSTIATLIPSDSLIENYYLFTIQQ